MKQRKIPRHTDFLNWLIASFVFLHLLVGVNACATPPRTSIADIKPSEVSALPRDPVDQPLSTPISLSAPGNEPEITREVSETQNLQATQSVTSQESIPSQEGSSKSKDSPSVLLISENDVMRGTIAEGLEQVDILPEDGPVVDAVQTGDQILVLRQNSLQKESLSGQGSQQLASFELPALAGNFVKSPDGTRIAYSIIVDDPGTEFGFRTLVSIYNTTTNSIQDVLSHPQNLRILGFTPDGNSLYILPVGQDPDFVSILQVAIQTGELTKELSVQGSWYAALSPDGRILSTTELHCLECDQPEGVISLYDLPSLPLTSPRLIPLPNAPSHINGLAWSPDGTNLYIFLVSGNPWDDPQVSYGIWRLEINSGTLTHAVALDDVRLHLLAVSPDGGWLLLEHETETEAVLVELATGQIHTIDTPAGAVLAEWR